jgi:hypothetical protein
VVKNGSKIYSDAPVQHPTLIETSTINSYLGIIAETILIIAFLSVNPDMHSDQIENHLFNLLKHSAYFDTVLSRSIEKWSLILSGYS